MSTTQSTAYGFGIATQNQSGQTLECSFYALGLGKAPENNIDATIAWVVAAGFSGGASGAYMKLHDLEKGEEDDK